MNDRPNYYLLLGLDPSEKDRAKIDETIRKRQADWSRERNHPTRGRQAQKNLELIKHIKEVLSDAAQRDTEAKEAVQQRHALEKQAAAALDEKIRILSAAGFLWEEQLATLIEQHKGTYSEAEVRRRVKLPIRREQETAAAISLEPTLAAEIADRLTLLGKKDLYAFLGLSRISSIRALQEATRKVDALVRMRNERTAEVTAQHELIGYCSRLFKDEAEREKYNITLNQQGYADLDPILAAVGSARIIQAAVMDQLLRKARELGLEVAPARRYILEVAARRKWAVEVSADSAVAQLQRCGLCGVVNEASVPACRECGALLVVECPKCRKVNPTENRACSRCGVFVGDAALVRRLLTDADLALARGDMNKAAEAITDAEQYWPDAPEVLACRAAVRKQKADVEAMDRELAEAISQKRFNRASELLDQWKRTALAHPNGPALEKQIRAALHTADAHVRKAVGFELAGRIDNALDAYSEALWECQDCGLARAGLAKWPPEPPTKLCATLNGAAVDLQWQASPAYGALVYRVRRRTGAEPTSATDGEEIGVVAALSLTDRAVRLGEWYYYAVYAERSDALSIRASVVGPVLRVGEVSGLNAIAGDRCITLEWQPPARAKNVEIWRAEGEPPSRRGEGECLAAATLFTVMDVGLHNASTYGYLAIAVYEGVDGKPIYSEGTTTRATPAEPPPPITDLTAKRLGDEFEATWTAPARVQVRIVVCAERPTLPYGKALSAAGLDGLGESLPLATARSARGKIGTTGVVHLLPITVRGTAAVVGKAFTLICVDDVKHLSLTLDEVSFLARWDWPPETETALVTWRVDQFPTGPQDAEASRERYLQCRYDQTGGFRHALPDASRLFVVVYAMANRTGTWHYAAGASKGACKEIALGRCRRLNYRIVVRKKLWGLGEAGGFALEITPDAEVVLPSLLLVVKESGMPLNPKNGSEVLTTPAGVACSPQSPLIVPFDGAGLPPRWTARLFPVNEEECDGFELKQKS